MYRKAITWVVTLALAVGIVAAGTAWATGVGRRARDLTLQLEAERQRNFMELVGHVQSIQSILGKGLAAGSRRQNMLYMGEVYRRASLATANFMALPLPGPVGASTGKFLNQVGDFAFSIARGEASGRQMDGNQRTEMTRLRQSATDLARSLQETGRQAAMDGFRWVEPPPRVADVFRGFGRRRPLAKPEGTQSQSAKNLLPGGLDEMGAQMEQMPTLIYDGPFSDHLEQRQARLGGEPIGETAAQERALSFLADAGAYQVVQVAKREGVPPTFSVRLATAGSGSYTVVADITRDGGHLVSLVNARPAGTPTLDLGQARDLGRKYLDEHGFPNMIATYGEAIDGFATVQYARNHDGTVVYPEQIKLRVALDTGEVVGVDARHYVMTHRDRGALPKPDISEQDAALVLNPNLKVQRVRLTVIPTEAGDSELMAYEFLGLLDEETFLVYVNAETGEEERILQLITTPNGTLTL